MERDDFTATALGRWFLTALEYGVDDDRAHVARDIALRHGATQAEIDWASTQGLEIAHRFDE